MPRYIDADKAKEKLGVVRGAYSCFLEEDRPYYEVLSETIKMINEMPIADVIEVVRCKDCKYMTEHYDVDGNAPYWTCSEWDSGTDYDGFCSYGERR